MKKLLFKFKGIGIVITIYLIIILLNKSGFFNPYVMQLIQLACINVIMTLSLQVINGYTGQFSIGQAGFMSIGAYVSAIFTNLIIPQSLISSSILQLLYFLVALMIGGIVTAFVGLLVILPCAKLRGDYLAIVTLGFGEIIRAIIRMTDLVGGPRGFSGIPKYSTFTIIFIIMILVIVFIRNFVDSSFGKACISIRENEIAAGTLGIDVAKYKMLSFAISAFIAGIAGGLFAHSYSFLQPDQFGFLKSCDYLVFLYAGGIGSISGSIISAVLLTLLPEMLRFLTDWRLVIYSLLLITIMLKRPNGIYGGKEFPILRMEKRTLNERRYKIGNNGSR